MSKYLLQYIIKARKFDNIDFVTLGVARVILSTCQTCQFLKFSVKMQTLLGKKKNTIFLAP